MIHSLCHVGNIVQIIDFLNLYSFYAEILHKQSE